MVTASLFYPALHHFKSSLQIMIILCYVRCVLWFHRSRAEQESENASKGQKYTKTNKQNTPKYRIIKLSCETRLNIICAINLVSVPALIKKLPLEGEIRTVKLSMKLSINPSLVMMRECPCSTKTREVLGNPSPPPSRFSSAVGFAPLDPRDFPRASPSGNLLGLGGCISQYIPPLGSVRIQYLPSLGGARTFSHHYQGRIDWQLHTLLHWSNLAI